jgi:hypothetical protein
MTALLVTLLNGFTGGTQGTQVAPWNSGNPSGNPWDFSLVSAGATLAYDSTQVAHYQGNFSCKVATVASGSSYLSWSSSLLPGGATSQAQVWFRGYFYFTATPSVTTTVFLASGASGTCGTVKILTSGLVAAFDAAGVQQAATATAIPHNQWIRIEAMILGDPAAGQMSVSLYTVFDSTTAASAASATGLNTSGAMTSWRFGQATNAANVGPYWMDDCALSNSGAVGPVLNGYQGLRIDGGECSTMVAVPAAGGAPGNTLAIGGDVEGFWTSTDQGAHWKAANAGVYSSYMRFTACTEWSLSEANTLYACAGNNGAGGGFAVGTQGTNGQWQWAYRNTVVQYSANGSNYPNTVPADPSRPTGRLLVQASGSLFYTATYSQGVYKSTSAPIGTSWTGIGLGGGTHFLRSLAVDPSNPGNLYVCAYNEGVYLITGANTGSPSAPVLLAGSPQFPEDILILANGNIYVAAGYGGTGQAGYAPGGVWTSTTAANTTWSSLDAAGSFLGSTSWWMSIDGYTDTLGGTNGPYDQLVVGCNKAVKPSGATATRNLAWITVSTVTGSAQFSDISTSAANIQSADIPPLTVNGVTQGRTNWHAGSPDALGGSGMIQPRAVIDKATVNTSNVTVYCAGSGGFWISTGNTVGASGPTASPTPSWNISNGGMQMIVAHQAAVSPGNPLHLVLGSSDHCSLDVSDGVAYSASTTTQSTPAGIYKPNVHYGEGYGFAFDPQSESPGNPNGTVYLSTGQKYTNNAGQIWARPGNSFTYVNISAGGSFNPGTGNGQVAYGLAGGRYSDGTPYLLALIQGAAGAGGMYRFSGYSINAATGAVTIGSGSWAHVDSTIGTTGGVANLPNNTQDPILIDPANPANCYAFDQNSGIWRNTSYGIGTWTHIWSGVNVSDSRTGFIALNPSASNELWVSFTGTGGGGGGLFYIPNASTVAPGTGSSPPAGTVTVTGITNPGAICFSPDGTVYCLALQVASGPYLFTQLMGSLNKGSSWFNADNGTVAATASKPSNMVFAPNGRIYISNDSNVLSFGYPAVPADTGQGLISFSFSVTAVGTDVSGPGKHGFAQVSFSLTVTASGNATHYPAANISFSLLVSTSGGATSAIVQQVNGTSSFDYGSSCVEMTTTAGNTLVMLAGWDLSTGPTTAPMPAVYVHDSAGNYWYHVDTSASGMPGSRSCAWICPNANPITWLSVSLTTFASALAYTVLEVSGMPALYSLDVSDAAGNASAASLALKPGTATDTDFGFAVFATGALTAPPATPAGWSALTSVTSSGGLSPAQNPVQIFPYFINPSAGTSLNATYTVGQAVPVSGVSFAVKTTVSPPPQNDNGLPVIKTEAGFGFTPGDPSQAPPSWTDITNRVIGPPGQAYIDIVAGRQYEQAAAEAGVMEIWLDNHTGDFTPGNENSIYAPGTGVILKTPVRVSAFWNMQWFPLGYGYVERWPQEWPDLPQWGISKMVATDAISVLAGVTMASALDSDILLDAPYVLLNAGEQYLSFSNGLTSVVNGFLGSQSAANAQGLLAQNSSRYNQRPGIYVDGNSAGTGGSGPAIAATGQTTSLLGSAGTGFGTAAIVGPITAPSSGPGILYTDPGMPDPVSGSGVTVTFWVIITADVGAANLQPTIFTAYGPPSNYKTQNASLSVQILNETGNNTIQVTLADGSTVSAPFSASANAQAITLVMTASSLTVYVNGSQATATGLSAAQTTEWQACSLGCPNYAYQAGGNVSGSFTAFDLAIFPYPLPAQRVNSQYVTGAFGQQNTDAVNRCAQILAWAGLGIPVAGRITFNGITSGILQGPAYNLAGTTAADAVNQVAVNENTQAVAAPDGTLVYIHKWASFNQAPVAVLGDSPVPAQGDVAFLQGQAWDYDDTYLSNNNQVTLQYGANNLFTVQVVSFPSQASYFARTAGAQTITTMSSGDATDLANWQSAKYAQPALRVSGLSIDAASNPSAAFPAVLGLQQAQVATVTRNPMGAAPITGDTLIQKIHQAIGPGIWSIDLQLSPYSTESSVLELDASPYNSLGNATLA